MMRKKRLFIIAVLILSLFSFAAFGCTKITPPENIEYTVTFDANGGQFDGGKTVYTQTVKIGTSATPKTPTRDGYNFGGWFVDSGCTSVADVAAPVVDNITYYAGWNSSSSDETVSVTYNLNYEEAPDGGIYTTQTVEVGSTLTKPADPERDGFTFVGWTKDAEGKENWTFPTYKVTGAMTLYAKWQSAAAAQFTGIRVTPPTKLSYLVGEELDLTGMVVEAVYDDETTKPVVTGYDVTAPDMSTAGEKTVTVTYKQKIDEFRINVTESELTGIEVSEQPTKKQYIVGQQFDKTGMVVKAVYDNGDKIDLAADDYTVTVDLSAPGTVSATVSYSGKNATVDGITVIARSVVSVAVTGTLTKSEYKVGEAFSPAGLIFTATYNDGASAAVAASQITFESSALTAGRFNAAGSATVTAKLGGITAAPAIRVTVTEAPITDGVYLVGTFNSWEKQNAYKAEEQHNADGSIVYAVSQVPLAAAVDMQFVRQESGKDDAWFGTGATVTVNPSGAMTVAPVSDETSTNYSVTKYDLKSDMTWKVEWVEKEKNGSKTYEIVYTLDYWKMMRDPTDPEKTVTASAAKEGALYLRGNFTDGYGTTDKWSSLNTSLVTVSGKKTTFTKVYLKQYDEFKLCIPGGKKAENPEYPDLWLGGTFGVLGTAFECSEEGDNIRLGGITDGFYNITVDATSGYKLTVTKWTEPLPEDQVTAFAVSGTLEKSEYHVGDAFDATGLTFTATYKNSGVKTLDASQVTFAATGLSGGKFTAKGDAIRITVSFGGITATQKITVKVTEAPIPVKPTDGVYLVGSFTEWTKKVENKATVIKNTDSLVYRIENVTLANGYLMQLVRQESGKDDAWFGTGATISVNPSAAMTVEKVTNPKDSTTNYGVTAYNLDSSEKWTVDWVEKEKDNSTTYEIVFTLNNFNVMRDPTDPEKTVTASAAVKDKVYLQGNFTDGYKCAEAWSELNNGIAKVSGNTITFTKVYLKQYDEFKVVIAPNTWLGGSFKTLGTAFALSKTGDNIRLKDIDNGFYNITYVGGENATLKIEKWTEPLPEDQVTAFAVSGTLKKSEYHVGDAFDATGLTFTATYKNSGVKTLDASQVTFAATGLSGGKFTAKGDAIQITVSFGGITATQKITVKVTEPPVPEKPADGLYAVGTFSSWGDVFDTPKEAVKYHLAAAGTGVETIDEVKYTTKSYVVTGLDLSSTKGDAGKYAEFKLVNYTSAGDGAIDWHADWYNGATPRFDITIVPNNPSSIITAYLYNNVQNIVVQDYDVDKSLRWTFMYVEKTKSGEAAASKFELIIMPDGYNDLREIEGEATGTPSLYLAGNFTGGFALKPEWSNVNKSAVTTDGKVYTFSNVPLKKYDTFKIVSVSGSTQSWMGGTFAALGTAFDVKQNADDRNIYLDKLTDGLYNVKVDMSGSVAKVTIYKAVKITVELKDGAKIYVGNAPQKSDITVKADGAALAESAYALNAAKAVEGENTLTVTYNGVAVELKYTATALEVTKTELTADPAKTSYNVGESVSLDGAKVTLTYNSGATKEVTDGITYACAGATNGKFLTAGTFTVEIEYDGAKLGEISVTVANVMTSLTVVSKSGDALEFVQDSAAPDLKSLITVTANYNEGVEGATDVAPATVTEYTLSALDMSKVGEQTVTVSCGGVNGSLKVNIVAPTVTSVVASGTLTKTAYTVGDTFDPSGVTVIASYNNGKSVSVDLSEVAFTCEALSGEMFVAAGSYTVAMSYNESAVTGITLAVTVENKLTSITVTAQPTKTTYYSGDKIDLTGMKLSANYNEGIAGATVKTEEIATGYTTSPDADAALAASDNKITVSYGGKTATVNITVIQKAAESITIGGTIPDQYLNTQLNIAGVTVTVVYNSGETETFDASELEGLTFSNDEAFDENKKFKTWGDAIAITATYDGQTTTFNVKVINETKYDVEFILNNPMGTVAGAKPAKQTVKHGGTVTEPTDTLTLIGYEFDGWYTEAACTTAYDFASQVTSEKTLYAKWTAKSYSVVYNLDGGVNATENVATYTADANSLFVDFTLNAAAKDHFDFDGWFENESYSGTAVTKLDYAMLASLDGNTITLYAKFTPATYTVTFVYGNGAENGTVQVTYNATTGKVARPETDPTREGYTFGGWTVGGTEYDFDSIVTSDIMITANWNRITCVVTFDSNGGSAVAAQNVGYGEKATKPENPTRDGYSFVEWQIDGKAFDFDTAVKSSVTLTAAWIESKFTVTFDLNGATGTAPAAQSVGENGTVTEPETDPTKAGSRFDGWYKEKECTTAWNFATDKVTADTTLYAKWVEQATVTFDLNLPEGKTAADVTNAPEAKTVDKNTAIETPTEPTLDGYAFNGWFADKAGTSQWNFADKVTSSKTLYAKWTKVADGKMTVVSGGASTEIDMLDNSDNMSADEKNTYDKNYAFFGEHKVALKTNDVLTFKVSGTAVSFTLDPYSKNVTSVAGTPTKLKVSADGDYEIYLKHNKTNNKWEIYASGGPVLSGNYYIAGTFNSWTANNANYKLNNIDGSITLNIAKNAKFKVVKDSTWYGYYIDGTQDSRIAAGTKYVQADSENNIQILDYGKYKLVFDGDKLSITLVGDYEGEIEKEPVLTGKSAVFKFDDATIVICLTNVPNWADASSEFVHIWSSDSDAKDYSLDGKSTYILGGKMSSYNILVAFKQGSTWKKTSDISGMKCNINGTTKTMSDGHVYTFDTCGDANGTGITWNGDIFTYKCTETAISYQ